MLMDLKKVFTRENPLFEHARMQLWVAQDGQRDVGRIAGLRTPLYGAELSVSATRCPEFVLTVYGSSWYGTFPLASSAAMPLARPDVEPAAPRRL